MAVAKSAPSPKYRQIANELLKEIRDTMSVGAKLPSETLLAERYKVHVLTIREALRVLQEGGVIQRQRAVGTTVVNPLGGNWVTILCEMNVFSPNSRSLFQRSAIYHLRHFLSKAGLPSRVSIGESEPGEQSGRFTSLDFAADVEAERLAGVIALSTIGEDWWMQKLKRQGVPMVGSNTYFENHVIFDSWEDLSKAFRCLLDLGRSKIAYIGWMEMLDEHPIDERLVQALKELESCYPVTLRKKWIKGDIHPVKAGAGWEEFREVWGSYDEKPDGLIIDNEHLLPDIEDALTQMGIRVPEDLVIICHRTRGNNRAPRFPIIFQENDPNLYAFRMAEHFLRLYRGENVSSPTVTVPRLLIDDALRSHPSLSTPRRITLPAEPQPAAKRSRQKKA